MRPGWPLLTWLFALFVCALLITNAPPLRSDLAYFLPQSADPAHRIFLDQARHGPAARLVLAAIHGPDAAAAAATSRALDTGLERSGLFTRVENGEFAPHAVEPILFQYRYLLGGADEADPLAAEGLRAALKARLAELTSSASALVDKRQLAADPTGAYRRLIQAIQPAQGPERRNGVWFGEDNAALLLIETRASGLDLDAQEAALGAIRTTFSEVAGTNQTLMLSGMPVFSVDSRGAIRDETRWLTLAASVGTGMILLLAYRSIQAALLAALPLLTALLVGSAAVVALFGGLHGITIAFGACLIGVAVDYPLHLFSHMSVRTETDAAARLWPTLRLGVTTTAIGFTTLLLSDFGGLAELGVFAVAGLVAAALTTRWILPVLLHGPIRLRGGKSALAILDGAGRLPGRRVVPWLAAGLSIVVILQAGDALWETDLARLSPVSDVAKEADRRLRTALRAPEVNQLLLVAAHDAETALQACERLRPSLVSAVETGTVRGYRLPCDYLPSAAYQATRQQSLPEPVALRARLADAQATLPFRADAFERFLTDVDGSRQLQPLTPAMAAGTLIGAQLDTLLRPLDDRWLMLVPLSGVADAAELESMTAAEGARLVDVSAETARVIDVYRDEALRAAGWGAVLIAMVLTTALRSATKALRVFAPPVSAILATVGILAVLGQALSLFHLAALLLVLGLGLDYALFRQRHGGDAEREATAVALMLSAGSTVLVFGLMAGATIPVLAGIGMTVAIGVPFSLIFALLMSHNGGHV